MCDTLVALAAATAGGAALFGKNSDRERNEAQAIEWVAAARHRPGEALKVTYIIVPQVERTHACLISRPFWMWGAEMGANEHGVVIGNEAVHAVVPAARRRALIGMDLVRLGLERGGSAAEAAEVIIALLETHGQGGDCGHLGRFYYHNSFLIADRAEAYVLETVGRWWALEKVQRTRAISNVLSIGAAPQGMSADLSAHARASGWTDGQGRFDFADHLKDRARDQISRGTDRCARSSALLAAQGGRITPAHIRAILRDHGEVGPDWSPARQAGRSLCMHAGPGDRRSQTVGALVSELRQDRAIHWVTGTSAPCLSLFKPVIFGVPLPGQGPTPTDQFDPATLWWRHERLHRAVLEDYAPRAVALAQERDALEAGFAARMDEALALGGDPVRLQVAVTDCWREAAEAEERWRLASLAMARTPGVAAYGRSWSRLNQAAAWPRPI